ncbi:putative tRNA acetyltransferase [Saccharomycopsis crataegensis]|uniref:tRNA acetyltransferase n=1 Tax=Saccharomycopsis crataegensis TaxID=43959 RepID=A0AAV5QDH7_9ASCO|nr:putative tRNA acetyltransferase [Saccharomycopsis crataegensis]
MGKRRNGGGQDRSKKRYKVCTGMLEPGTAGVYATCGRKREKKCTDELMALFNDKIEEYGIKPLEDDTEEKKTNGEEQDKKELSIEDSIKAELEQLEGSKKKSNNKHNLLQPITLGQECLVFIKLRRPIDPEKFIHRILTDLYNDKERRTRFTLKLTPVQSSSSASIEEIQKLSKKVLARHFHNPEDQKKGIKFAINVSKRNFNTVPREELIKKIAECMGHENDHKVDLKNYDKLVMVECFKNNVGMSVADDYEKYSRYNVDQMYLKFDGDDKGDKTNTRVGENEKEIVKKDVKENEESKQEKQEEEKTEESTKEDSIKEDETEEENNSTESNKSAPGSPGIKLFG